MAPTTRSATLASRPSLQDKQLKPDASAVLTPPLRKKKQKVSAKKFARERQLKQQALASLTEATAANDTLEKEKKRSLQALKCWRRSLTKAESALAKAVTLAKDFAQERQLKQQALASLTEAMATRDTLAVQNRAYKEALRAAGLALPEANVVDLT